MKILLVHRYYWPDVTGYAQMLHIIAKHLAAEGHEVHVHTTPPSYNEAMADDCAPRHQIVDGITIRRTWMAPEFGRNGLLRSINALLFAVKVLIHAATRRRAYDVITVSTFPPTIMGLVGRVVSTVRRTKLIYHCQDIYPEFTWTGEPKSANRPLPQRVARRIDTRTCKRADAVIVLSRDMARTLRDRGVCGDHVHVLNNFIIEDFEPLLGGKSALPTHESRFTIVYAGNIGRHQDLDRVLDALRLLDHIDDLEFAFVGGGSHEEALKQRSQSEFRPGRVTFRPYMPVGDLMTLLSRSSLALVSLNRGVIRAAYPSKTMTNLAAGCRILALVEEDSQLAEQIRRHNLGRVCGLREAPAIADSILQEFERWKNVQPDRDALRHSAQEIFGREQALSAWTHLIESTC